MQGHEARGEMLITTILIISCSPAYAVAGPQLRTVHSGENLPAFDVSSINSEATVTPHS